MNIVFDLGGVVFRWQPEKIIRHVFQDPEKQDLVRSEIFEHADCVELDRGTITLFIDDMSENLATAAKIGINTIRFSDADQCRQALMDLGCF